MRNAVALSVNLLLLPCDSLHLASSLVPDANNRAVVPVSRRTALQHTLLIPTTTLTVRPWIAHAQPSSLPVPVDRGGKPFAPLQALLPVTRLKCMVDSAYDLSLTLRDNNNNDNNNNNNNNDKDLQQQNYETLLRIHDVLTNHPPLFGPEQYQQRQRRAPPAATAQLTAANQQQQQQSPQQNQEENMSIPDRIAAALNRADVQRQWGMLQYQESKLEQTNELRAAFNFYTSQLEFGDSYLWTASREERKRRIRQDAVPSLSAVIASDLDLRDLHRNEFLTAMDDVQAEVSYQLKQQQQDSMDTKEVVDLMNVAHEAVSKWFDLIAPVDIEEAMQVLLKEQQQQQRDS